jgi:hypothetical protein
MVSAAPGSAGSVSSECAHGAITLVSEQFLGHVDPVAVSLLELGKLVAAPISDIDGTRVRGAAGKGQAPLAGLPAQLLHAPSRNRQYQLYGMVERPDARSYPVRVCVRAVKRAHASSGVGGGVLCSLCHS